MGLDISHSILKQAAANIARSGLEDRITVDCQVLENLDLPDNTFDCVHCRGVLMHVPEWEKALANICRVLKPGGRIAILEANAASTDAAVVRLARLVMQRRSKMIHTPAGLEFWSEDNGVPFVVRMANIPFLMSTLRKLGVRTIARFATELLEIGRFPSDPLRNAAARLNNLWFSLHLPAIPSAGNAIIGEKL
jgi:ubiquinone/menaquinone biosynthesis C-methylase UbiE